MPPSEQCGGLWPTYSGGKMSGGWTRVRDVNAVYPFGHFTCHIKSFFTFDSREYWSLRPDKSLGDGATSHVVRVLPALIDKI